MATYNSNETIAVHGVASGGQVLSSTQYAVATYAINATGVLDTVYWGPGSTILSSVTVGPQTYSFFSGVVFQNTP